jgi:hypothetical protein
MSLHCPLQQCLSAPTRLELDRAHQKGESLDVGILSLRNLSRIPRRKLILWGCLAASSLPLHLLYVLDHYPPEESIIG